MSIIEKHMSLWSGRPDSNGRFLSSEQRLGKHSHTTANLLIVSQFLN